MVRCVGAWYLGDEHVDYPPGEFVIFLNTIVGNKCFVLVPEV